MLLLSNIIEPCLFFCFAHLCLYFSPFLISPLFSSHLVSFLTSLSLSLLVTPSCLSPPPFVSYHLFTSLLTSSCLLFHILFLLHLFSSVLTSSSYFLFSPHLVFFSSCLFSYYICTVLLTRFWPHSSFLNCTFEFHFRGRKHL